MTSSPWCTQRTREPARRVLVGIAGSPGAGKSTVGAALVERLGASAALLPMDGFHLPQAELVRLGRRDRMGAPDTFDVDGFVATLEAVRAARAFGNSGVTVHGTRLRPRDRGAGAGRDRDNS